MTDTSLTNPPINANHNSLANPFGNSLPNPMAHNSSQHGFSFFTNYAHVLLLIAQASDVRMRELAADIGITERAIQRIIEELVTAGYLSVKKEGAAAIAMTFALSFRSSVYQLLTVLLEISFGSSTSNRRINLADTAPQTRLRPLKPLAKDSRKLLRTLRFASPIRPDL